MKTGSYIFLLLGVLCLCGCVQRIDETPPEVPETRGLMSVGIVEADGPEEDKLETVRFFVFKNIGSNPQLELNRRFTIPAPDLPGGEVTRFSITLEVSRKSTGPNDKIVVAVVNEPSAVSAALERCSTYDELHNLQLELGAFIRPDHQALQPGKTMPMTGAAWTDKIYPDAVSAQSNPVEIGIERAVARVEVYLRRNAGVDFDIASGSAVTLQNTYEKQFFVHVVQPPEAFGKINTVPPADLLSKSWIHSGSAIAVPEIGAPGGPGLLLCSFYTPERTCRAAENADKLALGLELKSAQGETRSAIAVLDEMVQNNIKITPENIERNNIYRLIITVTPTDMQITALVTDWTDEDFEIEF